MKSICLFISIFSLTFLIHIRLTSIVKLFIFKEEEMRWQIIFNIVLIFIFALATTLFFAE